MGNCNSDKKQKLNISELSKKLSRAAMAIRVIVKKEYLQVRTEAKTHKVSLIHLAEQCDTYPEQIYYEQKIKNIEQRLEFVLDQFELVEIMKDMCSLVNGDLDSFTQQDVRWAVKNFVDFSEDYERVMKAVYDYIINNNYNFVEDLSPKVKGKLEFDEIFNENAETCDEIMETYAPARRAVYKNNITNKQKSGGLHSFKSGSRNSLFMNQHHEPLRSSSRNSFKEEKLHSRTSLNEEKINNRNSFNLWLEEKPCSRNSFNEERSHSKLSIKEEKPRSRHSFNEGRPNSKHSLIEEKLHSRNSFKEEHEDITITKYTPTSKIEKKICKTVPAKRQSSYNELPLNESGAIVSKNGYKTQYDTYEHNNKFELGLKNKLNESNFSSDSSCSDFEFGGETPKSETPRASDMSSQKHQAFSNVHDNYMSHKPQRDYYNDHHDYQNYEDREVYRNVHQNHAKVVNVHGKYYNGVEYDDGHEVYDNVHAHHSVYGNHNNMGSRSRNGSRNYLY